VIAGFVKAGKMRGCGSRDLNKSREAGYPVCERSHTAGRSFASSVSAALFRALRRTIAQGGAIVRFISVFSTFWRTSANDRSMMGECSLPQCAKCHYARIKLKKHKIQNILTNRIKL
jgi:hypothetical protein